MDVLSRIFKRPSGRIEVPGVIDHVPVDAGLRDWREERLKQAQERYGRPFKCAAAALRREILVKPRPPSDIALDDLREPAHDRPAARPKEKPRCPSSFRFGGR
jgi:hypothetical protein